MRCFLDAFAAKATPHQIDDLLNDFANLYELCLFVSQVDFDSNSASHDILRFDGTPHGSEQHINRRNCILIEYDANKLLFKLCYTLNEDGSPQTLFYENDSCLFDHVNNSIPQLIRGGESVEKQYQDDSFSVFRTAKIITDIGLS